MTLRQIYIAPDPVLKETAVAVDSVTPEIQKLMDDMLDTMYAARGIGLAATQIGVMHRVIVMDLESKEGKKGMPLFFVNPEIIETSEETNVYNEGCLSIPGQYADVERPETIKFKFLDYDGTPQEIETDGILATCMQHEIDHLNGVLFTDHLSSLKRNMIMKKLKKYLRDYSEDLTETHIL